MTKSNTTADMVRRPFRLGEHLVDPSTNAIGDVRIDPKAMDVLVALAEAAPHVVSVAALLDRAWPNVVVGDNSLFQAIAQLRKALGDQARDPRFIEHVSRRGYRLLVPVESLGAGLADEALDTANGAETLSAQLGSDAASTKRVLVRRRRLPRWPALVFALCLIVGLYAVWTTWRSPQPHITGDYTPITQIRDRFSPYWSPYPLATDGTRIYFNEWLNGDHAIRQISVRGGDPIAADPPFGIGQHHLVVGLTPDRAELLVMAAEWSVIGEGDFWLWSPAGGSPRRFLESQGHEVVWSDDGESVVHVTGSDVFVARGDGTNSHKILTGPARVYWPRVSPDGRRIRFTAKGAESGLLSLWEASIDGSDMRPLLPGWNTPTNECCGSWTVDGKYFVFQATRDYRTHLWALPERRGFMGRRAEPVQLTTGTMDFIRPLIAPEGHRIYAIGWHPRGEVRRFDGPTRQFVKHEFPRSAEWLTYTRDGKRVAYVTYPEADLWWSRSNGENPLQITRGPLKGPPAWSPDGETLAFNLELPGQPRKIYLADANADSAPRPLTAADRREGFPTWSSDGRSIAFRTETSVRIFELEDGTETPLEGAERAWEPQWSPDGRFICAKSLDDPKVVMMFDVSTRRWQQLAKAPAPIIRQRWAPDGRYLYFLTEDPASELYRIDVADRAVELVFSLRQEPWIWGVFGLWFGFDTDGAPLYLHDQSISHIYALDWND